VSLKFLPEGEGDRGAKRRGGGVAHGDNLANYGIQIFEDMSRWNTQNLNALTVQPAIASQVPIGLITHVVRHSVDFDAELGAFTVKIEDEGAARVLAPKFEIVRAPAKGSPEQSLRQGQ
jgi:hypothetical protein